MRASGRLAGVRGEPEHDLVDPGRIERHGVAIELDRGLVRARRSSSDLDVERVGPEAERPKGVVDRAGQSSARLPPSHRQRPGGSRHGLEEPGIVGLARSALVGQALEPLDLGSGALAVGHDRGLVVAVATLQPVDERQAILYGEHGRRVELGGLGEPAHVGRDVLDLRVEAAEALGNRLEARIEPRHRGGLGARLAHDLAGPLLAVEGGPDRARAPGDRLAVPRQVEAGLQLGCLARVQACHGDLVELVPQQLQAPVRLPRLDRQLGQRGAILAPARDRDVDRGAKGSMVAERIEQLALPALVEEP
jgi:hypothetical protein